MAWELIEEPLHGGPMGTFTPRADQNKYRSAFGVVGGVRQPGWPDATTFQGGITSQDGRGRLKMEAFKDGDKQPNKFKFNGMELQEFIAPREDFDAKAKHDARISEDNALGRMATTVTPATDTQIGRSSVGQAAFTYPATSAQ